MIRLCVFILFGNPLSMFVFHTLFPRKASGFARNPYIFGEKIHTFYTKLALKWPNYWAKWWMQVNDFADYTAEQQIKYLFEVAFRNQTEVEVLKAMGEREPWPEAYEKLFSIYGQKILPLKPRDIENRASVPKWNGHKVAEFMMQNVRLSYNALSKIVYWAKSDEQMRKSLSAYLASGKLNDDQFKLLVNAVATDKNGGDLQMFGVLLDYIKRYGITIEQQTHIRIQYPKKFVELVVKEANFYQQAKITKSFKNTVEGRADWHQFCVSNRLILPEVQAMMSAEQYAIFHTLGRELDVEAIKAFLQRPDKALWRTVFAREQVSCQTAEMRAFIRSKSDWDQVYREVQIAQDGDEL